MILFSNRQFEQCFKALGMPVTIYTDQVIPQLGPFRQQVRHQSKSVWDVAASLFVFIYRLPDSSIVPGKTAWALVEMYLNYCGLQRCPYLSEQEIIAFVKSMNVYMQHEKDDTDSVIVLVSQWFANNFE